MARNYSTKDFFRQMPNALLHRYFQKHGQLNDVDFAALSETKTEKLFAAWLSLPDIQRSTMDAELREIFELSCEKGYIAIQDEAKWQLETDPASFEAFIEKLAALGGDYERAMVTFLDHHTFWKGASRFYHADSLPYWRKRGNFPHKSAAVDQPSIDALASQIGMYFRNTEGRGKNCVVEPFRRGELDYFFAYPEDYSKQSIEWAHGEFERRSHNPAFEVVFVYSKAEGSLDLNFRGSYKAVEPLQAIFANTILKLPELPPNPKDERVYDLDPLLKKGFDFSFAIGSGIEKVTVKKIRLSSRSKKGDRIVLEADTSENSNAVYDLLDKIKTALPLHQYNISQIELAVTVTADANKAAKVVTVRITHPNSCSLKYDELDLKLRDMLNASGIEPREQVDVPELVATEEATLA